MGGDADSARSERGVVRVQISGRTDHMSIAQLAAFERLPDYFRDEGFAPDLFYQEPGGQGTGPVEEIALYVGTSIASGLIGSAAWAAVSAVSRWAKARIHSQHPSENLDSGTATYVSVNLYSVEGVHVSHIHVTGLGVDPLYTHSVIGDDPDREPAVVIEPNEHGYLAVSSTSGLISCLVRPDWLGCETPATNWPAHEDGTPFHSVKCDSNGALEWADGQIGDLPRTTIGQHRYQALGWTIRPFEDGLHLSNDETGHGIYVTPRKVERF